jgi:predicted RNA-binding Zn-ribbon protein involved in translation (DUF1610 family)
MHIKRLCAFAFYSAIRHRAKNLWSIYDNQFKEFHPPNRRGNRKIKTRSECSSCKKQELQGVHKSLIGFACPYLRNLKIYRHGCQKMRRILKFYLEIKIKYWLSKFSVELWPKYKKKVFLPILSAWNCLITVVWGHISGSPTTTEMALVAKISV